MTSSARSNAVEGDICDRIRRLASSASPPFALPTANPLCLGSHDENDAVVVGLAVGLEKLGRLGHGDRAPLFSASANRRARSARTSGWIRASSACLFAGSAKTIAAMRDRSMLSGGVEHRVAEELAGRLGARAARGVEVLDDLVRVEDDGAQAAQDGGHRRLSGRETTGQADAEHSLISSSLSGTCKRRPRRTECEVQSAKF